MRPELPPQKVGAQEGKVEVWEGLTPQLAPQLERVTTGKCRLQAMPVNYHRNLALTQTAEVKRGKAVSELTLRQMLKRRLVA